ncbi:MAG: hypothetical protein NZ749_14920, partial [bacterium]|nr:hypothetical protein [bacterium]
RPPGNHAPEQLLSRPGCVLLCNRQPLTTDHAIADEEALVEKVRSQTPSRLAEKQRRAPEDSVPPR